jgi:(2Fe-2S) ferredoxin
MGHLTVEDLNRMKDEHSGQEKNWIRVGYSTCGIAAGADEVFSVLRDEVQKRHLDIDVKKCGCAGMCYAEPLVEVMVEGTPRVFYGRVDRDTAIKIIEKHVCGKMLLNDRIYDARLNTQS